MSSNPVFSYKTSTIGTGQPAPKTGKADTAGTSGTSGAPSAPSTESSYMDNLETEGSKKMGKTPPPGESESGDPVTDLLNTLDKINNDGVPQGNLVPFGKITAESALIKFLDFPQDVLTKFNSIVSIIQTKLSDLDKGLSSGTGTSQQVQAAQQLKAQLQDLLSFYKIQRDKVAEIIPQKEKFWANELKSFQENGGSSDPRDFDLDGDGWIGQPEAKGSYRIGTRTFDKPYKDIEAKQLADAGAKVQSEFKIKDIQYWAINPETNTRVQFDPKTKKVVGEQVAAPGYVADIGVGFANDNTTNVVPNEKGVIELKAKQLANTQNAFEAGLELHTPEYVYVEIDTDGEIVLDDNGQMKPAPFELKDGRLVQTTPTGDNAAHFKQVYVKKMSVSTDSKDGTAGGDIIVDMRGGDNNAKILNMRITAPDSKSKASDVALAITSGTGDSHRETAIILDAGAYESTSRTGIQNPTNFSSKFNYDASKKATGPQKDQINDTLKHFMAQGSSGKIGSDSLLNRGIAFQTKGHIIGTGDNDLFVVEEPEDYLTPDDAAYTTVIEGGAGHNALFGTKGSLFANGMTLVSKESGDANDEISIGINAYGEKKSTATGALKSTKGESSNKLYIHINASESNRVAFQSAVDGNFDASKDPGNDPLEKAWANDDYYDVKAKVVATNMLDANNPNQAFDPDLQTQKSGRKPIQGKMTSAATGDFQVTGQIYSEHVKGLEDSITKKTTEKDEDWKIDGTTQDWMKGKYYQADKNTLEQFFSDFSASKVKTMDPFKQLEDGIEQAGGDD